MIDIHLLVTTLCDRDCKYCCNKQYDVQNLQYVTDEELKDCRYLFLTGGEPFTYTNPNELARYYKEKYPNIEAVIVYTNAKELVSYLRQGGKLYHIDGLNISIKDNEDFYDYMSYIRGDFSICYLKHNRIYDFTGKVQEEFLTPRAPINIFTERDGILDFAELIHREWQKNFVPAEGSIFRRGN